MRSGLLIRIAQHCVQHLVGMTRGLRDTLIPILAKERRRFVVLEHAWLPKSTTACHSSSGRRSTPGPSRPDDAFPIRADADVADLNAGEQA
jgi:hypothetical protein